jgi:hypothetical protein
VIGARGPYRPTERPAELMPNTPKRQARINAHVRAYRARHPERARVSAARANYKRKWRRRFLNGELRQHGYGYYVILRRKLDSRFYIAPLAAPSSQPGRFWSLLARLADVGMDITLPLRVRADDRCTVPGAPALEQGDELATVGILKLWCEGSEVRWRWVAVVDRDPPEVSICYGHNSKQSTSSQSSASSRSCRVCHG